MAYEQIAPDVPLGRANSGTAVVFDTTPLAKTIATGLEGQRRSQLQREKMQFDQQQKLWDAGFKEVNPGFYGNFEPIKQDLMSQFTRELTSAVALPPAQAYPEMFRITQNFKAMDQGYVGLVKMVDEAYDGKSEMAKYMNFPIMKDEYSKSIEPAVQKSLTDLRAGGKAMMSADVKFKEFYGKQLNDPANFLAGEALSDFAGKMGKLAMGQDVDNGKWLNKYSIQSDGGLYKMNKNGELVFDPTAITESHVRAFKDWTGEHGISGKWLEGETAYQKANGNPNTTEREVFANHLLFAANGKADSDMRANPYNMEEARNRMARKPKQADDKVSISRIADAETPLTNGGIASTSPVYNTTSNNGQGGVVIDLTSEAGGSDILRTDGRAWHGAIPKDTKKLETMGYQAMLVTSAPYTVEADAVVEVYVTKKNPALETEQNIGVPSSVSGRLPATITGTETRTIPAPKVRVFKGGKMGYGTASGQEEANEKTENVEGEWVVAQPGDKIEAGNAVRTDRGSSGQVSENSYLHKMGVKSEVMAIVKAYGNSESLKGEPGKEISKGTYYVPARQVGHVANWYNNSSDEGKGYAAPQVGGKRRPMPNYDEWVKAIKEESDERHHIGTYRYTQDQKKTDAAMGPAPKGTGKPYNAKVVKGGDALADIDWSVASFDDPKDQAELERDLRAAIAKRKSR